MKRKRNKAVQPNSTVRKHRIQKIYLEPGTVINTILVMKAGESTAYSLPVKFHFTFYQDPEDKEKLNKVNWKINQFHDWRHLFSTKSSNSSINSNGSIDSLNELADIDFSIMKMKMSHRDFADWACIEIGRYFWEKGTGIQDSLFAYMAWILRYGKRWIGGDGSLAVLVDLGDNNGNCAHIRDLSLREIDLICRQKQLIWNRWINKNGVTEIPTFEGTSEAKIKEIMRSVAAMDKDIAELCEEAIEKR